jgi:hypothetical protein
LKINTIKASKVIKESLRKEELRVLSAHGGAL